MRIICVSDLHEHLPTIPAADLLLIAGDMTFRQRKDFRGQRQFLDGPFRKWCEAAPVKRIIATWGNHDTIAEWQPDLLPPDLPLDILVDEALVYEGLTIYGSPWQPAFCDWAFNLTSEQLTEKWAKIPPGVDILLVHGPPYGFGDTIGTGGTGGIHLGDPALALRIMTVQPRVTICGHIHAGYGVHVWPPYTTVINASLVDDGYRPVNQPVGLTI